MAARVPAADLNQHLSSPFIARRCHGPGEAALEAPLSVRIKSRTPRRRAESTTTRILCRGAEAQPGSGGGRRREPLRRGAVSARLPVPDHIRRPPYVGTAAVPEVCPDRQVHDGESIMRMLDACELAARVLHHAGAMVKPSVTTDEIDRAVHQMIVDAGAYPSPLGYGGFPKSVCTSVNECTCHGIPDSRELQDGDIINIDVTVYLNGYHGDTSRTYLCGEVDDATKQLVKVTEECMMRGISACRHGASFKEIGQRISEHAEKYGYGIDPFVGHGVGRMFHCEPIIWHTYDYEPGFMVAGQTFTVGNGHVLRTRAMQSRRCRWGARSAWCGTTGGRPWRRTAASARSSSTPCWSPATARRS
ncbi:methionine aminopeptidase 1B, chloroplastic isoform X1 [Zea mays]|uniref:Methionine aminopeptidase n=2 Tax=Zea mays TaxID=4577 RepID=A0A804NM95_MAIZE|nr:uncharacterized protein LOC100272473 isoform X1 [Zea mays]|eukprot:XP_008676740.1 uncharacterized protein LOC100272473 isoform X1 [Zea mays]